VRIRLRYLFYDLRSNWREIRRGLRNIRQLLPAVWRWCPWDWGCNYELFMYSLGLTRDYIATHNSYEGNEFDVADIDQLLGMWEKLQEVAFTKEEDVLWNSVHDLLKAKARRWWD